MKNIGIAILLFISWIFTSCNDGDIILTEFDFDEQTLELCNGSQDNDFVFFKINNSLQEAISLNFNSPDFSETPDFSEIPEKTSSIEISLKDTPSTVIYRKFDSEITSDYYCSTIPSAIIRVTEELVSTDGFIMITTTIENEDDNDGVDAIDESEGIDPVADPDNDGVPNYLDDDRNNAAIKNENGEIEAGFDTDDDGIPNYKDQDDDGDTILTSAELTNGIPDNDEPRDTDGDGIPDYKDDDDDDDGILTADEDKNGNNNVRDDDEDGDTIPDYLEKDTAIKSTKRSEAIGNTVQTTFVTRVTVTLLQFDGTTENFKDSSFSFGAKEIIEPVTTLK